MALHRARVMQLLLATPPHSTLCILGAGNCNDVDLNRLAEHFELVELVDLDVDALNRAVAQVDSGTRSSLRCLGGVDIAGLQDLVRQSERTSMGASDELSDVILRAREAPRFIDRKYDVVCSPCLLSQLLDSLQDLIPRSHPRFIDLTLAVRNRHLELLLQLLNPGGTAVLIIDFVSSLTAPEIAGLSDSQLPSFAKACIERRNFFTGCNPFAISAFFQSSPSTSAISRKPSISLPWRWDIGIKQFLVCAVTVIRN